MNPITSDTSHCHVTRQSGALLSGRDESRREESLTDGKLVVGIGIALGWYGTYWHTMSVR